MEIEIDESEINKDELWKILHLHKNSEYLRNIILANDNQILCEEFYLINIEWIKKFKEIYHFNSIVNFLKKSFKNLDVLQKENMTIKNLPKITETDREEIKIIKNEEIIMKYPEDESSSYFYSPFFLVHPKYYEIIIEGNIIDEKIKCDIYITNRSFLIDLSNNIIEVGIFDTTYSYKLICLLKFADNVNYKEEMYKIFSLKFFEYLYINNITEDMLIEYQDLSKDKFQLKRIFIDENVFNKKNEGNAKQKEKDLEIVKKFGSNNFKSSENSKLNSIIPLLTSIKEIYVHFMKNDIKYKIQKFHNIYIFSSYFLEAIKYVYGISNNANILKEMNIIINFLDEDISKKDIAEYLNFILQLLHNELLSFPDNLKQERLISYDSPLNDRNKSLEQFNSYYNNNYKKSIISGLFNWIKEKKVDCNLDHMSQISSFQSFPLIEFDFDLLYKNQDPNKDLILDLVNCFMDYQKISIDDNPNLGRCAYCNMILSSKYIIHDTPPYFMIVLNRKNRNNIKIKYKNILDITSYIEKDSKFKKYKLISVIMEEGNNFYTIIESPNKKNDDDEVWTKFQGETVSTITINCSDPDIKAFNEVYNPINSRLLLYKGIK